MFAKLGFLIYVLFTKIAEFLYCNLCMLTHVDFICSADCLPGHRSFRTTLWALSASLPVWSRLLRLPLKTNQSFPSTSWASALSCSTEGPTPSRTTPLRTTKGINLPVHLLLSRALFKLGRDCSQNSMSHTFQCGCVRTKNKVQSHRAHCDESFVGF